MKKLLLLILIGLNAQGFAQDVNFGKISREELEEQVNALDASADAAYLYKYRRTYFDYNEEQGFQLITEVHERLKIYNQNGFDHATQDIRLNVDGNKDDKLSNLKAYTYNLVDGKIEEDKLKNDGIFETEPDKYHKRVKFTMPNLKPGSVVEYQYKIYSPFFWYIRDYEFQFDIPVKQIEAKFETPEYYNFKRNMKGFLPIKDQVETRSDKIYFKATREVREGFVITQQAQPASTLDFKKTVTSYNLTDVPALKDEPLVNNINNYRSSVNYELSYVNFPNSPIKYYSTTWEDVVKAIYENPSFGSELNKSGYYNDDIDALIGHISDPIQRVALIYNFVKANVKWNGYYSKYADEGVRTAYKNHVGNVGDINLMLTSMLRYAGLNANPVLVSTRSNGIPLFPTREGYNYVISAVEINNGIILLDGTSPYSALNVLPIRALNWQGRLIKKDGSSALIDLYPSQQSQNTVSLLVDLKDNGDIEGMVRSAKTNHDALLFRGTFMDSNKDQYLENLENKYGGLEISEHGVSNEQDLDKPVTESFKFLKENQSEIIGDKMYFSPLFFLTTRENPFKLEKREFPVDFGYPSSTKYRVTINLPQGYKLESLPEQTVLKLPDELGSFKYMVSANGASLQLIIESQINQSLVSPLYYDALKEYFKNLIEKENEKIVLTKV